MRRMSRKLGLMGLGLGALLTVGMGAWGIAGAAPGAPMPPYTGQVKEIKIDQCGLEPGTCEGSVVLRRPEGRRSIWPFRQGPRFNAGINACTLRS